MCAPCTACGQGEYEAAPCGPYDRICFGYASLDVAIRAGLLSRYNASDLGAAYLPAMLAFLRAQTRAGVVAIRVLGSEPWGQALGTPQPDGTLELPPDGGYGPVTLYPLAGQPPGGSEVYLHDLNITLRGLFEVLPNSALDFSVLLERAMYSAEAQLVEGAPDGLLERGRRLLSAVLVCPSDFYPVSYPLLGPICVPCQFDPVLTASPRTPVNLRWALAAQPCPQGFARQCYGGQSQPVCISRASAAVITTVSASQQVSCPDGQVPAQDPASGGQLCTGVPCAQGLTGPAGACAPCPPGAYKPAAGPDPCTPCPAGTYSPFPGQAAESSCQPCPTSSWADAGSAGCTCNAGYAGNTTGACMACAPGTYKLMAGAGACLQCHPGGVAAGGLSTQCQPCLPGTYASGSALSVCSTCDAGFYQYLVGSTDCPACAPGYASPPAPPLSHCEGCAEGTFAPAQGTPACLSCPHGAYSYALATACQACPDGTAVEGQSCVACAPGTAGRGGDCAGCPAGAYAGGYGQASCAACETGKYNTAGGRSSCSPCPPGRAGAGCAPCPAGQYATGSGLRACTACGRGLYTPTQGTASPGECRACEPGTYWGQDACTPCPTNTLAPSGSFSVLDCLAAEGYYGLPGQQAAPCPPGSYCPQASMAPAQCPPGSYSQQASATCTQSLAASALRDYDWLVAASWLAVTAIGVACLVRTKRFWRSARRGQEKFTRNA